MATKNQILAVSVPVEITAADKEAEDQRPKFSTVVNTGKLMEVDGYEHPVVIDIAGTQFAKNIVANLDHDRKQRVGHVTDKSTDTGQIVLSGIASAATSARAEVVESAKEGFQWEASIEARPIKMSLVKKGATKDVNGKSLSGPFFHVEKSFVNGFAFVSHGADDDTTVNIAAEAASKKELPMEAKFRSWVEAMLPETDVDTLPQATLDNLQLNFKGQNGKKVDATSLDDAIDAKQADVNRTSEITEIALKACDRHPHDIESIKVLAAQARDERWTVDKFRLELLEATTPPGTVNFTARQRTNRITDKVLEAAICQAGRLDNYEKSFDDQTLQLAQDRFKSRVGLKQLFVLAAQDRGYNDSLGYDVDINVQRAAFGQTGPQSIDASSFSTLSLPNVLSNVANKFLKEGFMSVDQVALSIAGIRSVRDFKQTTTISLTGGLLFSKVGPDGEIKHGQISELAYTNQAHTYASMMGITRQDIINDDLSALTAVPRRLGRGGMLKLNDIFWAKFLNNGTFFAAGNNNIVAGGGGVAGNLSSAGLQQADLKFASQTDPDGHPLGESAQILLVPTALAATGSELMTSQLIVSGTDAKIPNNNIWQGRYQLLSSPYMHNASYTGNSAVAWYLLASPSSMPVIEIVALNGRVEPVVESTDADFNQLGVQMRGYSDVGVELQEFRGGVRADGVVA